MMIVYVAIGVSLITFIIYALDRRSKQEPLDWFVATKLSFFGGLIASETIKFITKKILIYHYLR